MPVAATEGAEAQPPASPARRPDRRRLIGVVVVTLLAVGAVGVIEATSDERPAAPPGSWTVVPHTGLGAWVDAYDWTVELGGSEPAVDLDDIDAMADAGVQTVYLQTGHDRSADDVMEPDRLEELIDEIHRHDMHVVAWYLPTLVDLDRDLRRLSAAAELGVDGLGVDIEATTVADPAERNRRVLELSARLRAAVGVDKALAAITLSSVHVEVVNPAYWPGFPFAELAQIYDALLPMAYWSIRTGELRAGERYVGENVDRLRAAVGPDVVIHVVGGIADGATVGDLEGMVDALATREVIGGSLYDWNTSEPAQWEALQPLRADR